MCRESHSEQECKQDEVVSFLNHSVSKIKRPRKHKGNIYSRYHVPNDLMGQEIRFVLIE